MKPGHYLVICHNYKRTLEYKVFKTKYEASEFVRDCFAWYPSLGIECSIMFKSKTRLAAFHYHYDDLHKLPQPKSKAKEGWRQKQYKSWLEVSQNPYPTGRNLK